MSSTGDVPATLGRYVIERVLGRGAMGVVYLAFDPRIERRVAIKTIHVDSNGDAAAHDLTARFLNEARAAGRLLHPNIVAIYDYGESGDSAFITMEYVRGESLAARLAQHARAGSRMSAAGALRWFAQLLDALDYAHDAGIVHRDIKPANLLIAPRGECKIADFGIAHLDTSALTQTGTLLGTPSYMSPEQFTGDPVDARSDLFSAAVVLYEMLTGVCPFTGTPGAVMRKILDDTPPAPTAIAPELPSYIDDLVMKGMAKRPDARYRSAREWRDALFAALATDAQADADRTVLAHASPHATLDAPPASADFPQDLIEQLEKRLASHVGPVASLLMRRARANATDIDTLRERLAAHLPTEAARRDFDALLTRLAAGASRSVIAREIGADSVSEAASRLTTYLGPIARIVARRAAANASDLPTFYARLLDAVPEQHREALRREWGIEGD
ncbi:serine/threonine protein kinase [Caballeronia novacaledonica]|uniref:non-specific serine/threonine protein kinase n=1 Tax=Caballeronia novacaledonica TaxID=1544861 RepID=A0A2U3I139_9BURK|nr:serine/threonine-protein kinase [Caballeronia novacaledonica]SPB13803.1 serine/threonine protein kinase [Caballeronia novacaledonica]